MVIDLKELEEYSKEVAVVNSEKYLKVVEEEVYLKEGVVVNCEMEWEEVAN